MLMLLMLMLMPDADAHRVKRLSLCPFRAERTRRVQMR